MSDTLARGSRGKLAVDGRIALDTETTRLRALDNYTLSFVHQRGEPDIEMPPPCFALASLPLGKYVRTQAQMALTRKGVSCEEVRERRRRRDRKGARKVEQLEIEAKSRPTHPQPPSPRRRYSALARSLALFI